MVSRRVPLNVLADFCDRFGTALQAGVDSRRALDGEVNRSGNTLRAPLQIVRDEVQRGASLSDAFAKTGGAFPPLFHELLAVGEETGKVDQILLRQARHYRHLKALRWLLVSMSAWPVVQLGAATLLIGILIVLLGTLVPGKIDILGCGVVGWSGLLRYISFLVMVVLSVSFVAWWVLHPGRRARLKSWASRLPNLNGYFTADAMARLCWTLSIVDEAGMDLRRGVRAALRSTDNQRYIGKTDEIIDQISRGGSMGQAFGRTGVFPYELIAALEVGEESGQISETLQNLSEQYRRQAESKSYVLTVVLSFCVWACVAAVIIFLIFRIAGFIFGTYEELSRPI
jgi:type IV pilus assembly protein PilC